MIVTAFDEVTRVDPGPAGLVGEVRPGWDLVVPSGGVTAGMGLRAVGRGLDEKWVPASFSCRFLRPARHGPIVFDVVERHRALRTRMFTAVATQGDATVAECGVWVVRPGLVGPAPLPVPDLVPEVPAPDGDEDEGGGGGPTAPASRWPLLDRVERRVPPRERTVRAVAGGGPWLRLRRPPVEYDVWLGAARSVLFLDTFPFLGYVTSDRPDSRHYVAQTLDLTVSFPGTSFPGTSVPASWLWLDADCDPGGGPVVAGRGRLRGADGSLVAGGHQTLICSRRERS